MCVSSRPQKKILSWHAVNEVSTITLTIPKNFLSSSHMAGMTGSLIESIKANYFNKTIF